MITVAKFLAYLHSGSSAMSSEAMHSLVDAANQLLLVVGLRSATMAPDRQHQYGYGKGTVRMYKWHNNTAVWRPYRSYCCRALVASVLRVLALGASGCGTSSTSTY